MLRRPPPPPLYRTPAAHWHRHTLAQYRASHRGRVGRVPGVHDALYERRVHLVPDSSMTCVARYATRPPLVAYVPVGTRDLLVAPYARSVPDTVSRGHREIGAPGRSSPFFPSTFAVASKKLLGGSSEAYVSTEHGLASAYLIAHPVPATDIAQQVRRIEPERPELRVGVQKRRAEHGIAR
eukprot:3149180-Rhodomonas_salina.1